MSFQTLEAVASRTRTVRVNLLPPELAEARRDRRLRLALAGGLVVVAGLCGTAGVVSAHHVSAAQDALTAEQDRTVTLKNAQKPYAQVPVVEKQLATVQAVQKTVSAEEVAWYSYLDQVSATAPEGVTLTALKFSVGGTTATGSTGAAGDPLAVSGAVGSLTVTGQTTNQDQIADWLDAVDGVPGIDGPSLTNTTLDKGTGVYTFDSTATVTTDALLSQQ